jgi:hypothetical protein
MIAFREPQPQRVTLEVYRQLLGPEASGLSDAELQRQLDADRALARALVTAISTQAADSGKRVAS